MGHDDFNGLEKKLYSGRGIAVGITLGGLPFVGYTLTGRSASSQARKLVYDDVHEVIRTDVTDRAILEKGSPALLLYPAVAHTDGMIVASNGAQTKLLFSEVQRNPNEITPYNAVNAMHNAMMEYDSKEGWIDIASYEPDAPNYTPRISAALNADAAALHIVRRHEEEKTVERWPINLRAGIAHMITTYSGGNEDPLLPFEGDPFESSIASKTPEQLASSLYEAIEHGQKPGDNYAVATAVMMLKDGKPLVAIRNRFE